MSVPSTLEVTLQKDSMVLIQTITPTHPLPSPLPPFVLLFLILWKVIYLFSPFTNFLKIFITFFTYSGLSYLHKNGLVHGDIKPQNILIERREGEGEGEEGKEGEERAVLCDFGNARFLGHETRGSPGTLIYTAPEMLSGREHLKIYRESMDVYSLGMVLWEIIHRKVPYTEDEREEGVGRGGTVVDMICSGWREKVSDAVPEGMREVIEGCWGEEEGRMGLEEVEEQLKVMMKVGERVKKVSKGARKKKKTNKTEKKKNC